MADKTPILLWYRRDLRLSDHQALAAAVEAGHAVIPVYIFSEDENKKTGGASKWWLHHSLSRLGASIHSLGGKLILRKGSPATILQELCDKTGARSVHASTCFDPYWQPIDHEVAKVLGERGIALKRFSGQLMWEPQAIRNKSGKPFQVFTPFWKHLRQQAPPATSLPSPKTWPQPSGGFLLSDPLETFQLLPTIGWDSAFKHHWTPGESGAQIQLKWFGAEGFADYSKQRDYPHIKGTSRLSPHLHFGEITPGQIYHHLEARQQRQKNAPQPVLHSTYMSEVGWREFAHHLLHHFPQMTTRPLREEFEAFPWREDEQLLRAWQKGQTGYPIVDAGMRELWTTGWMHNRVRMIVGSFLVKHLLLDWKLGAEWFWDTLVDADLPNNTMGWQWIAGCGADAAPYFRIFNPILQSQKFDAQGSYIRTWVPEISKLSNKEIHTPWTVEPMVLQMAGIELGKTYPAPIVNHTIARETALDAYHRMKADGKNP